MQIKMELVKVLLMLKAVYKESIIKKLLGDNDTNCFNETNPAHTLYH